MDVTVCICAHDRPGYSGDCLDGLRRQTVGDGRFDILVVDSASTGDIPAQVEQLVQGLRNARLLRIEVRVASVAGKEGAAEAAVDYIADIEVEAFPGFDRIVRFSCGRAARPARSGGRSADAGAVRGGSGAIPAGVEPGWFAAGGHGKCRGATPARGLRAEGAGVEMEIHVLSASAICGSGRGRRYRRTLVGTWSWRAAGEGRRAGGRLAMTGGPARGIRDRRAGARGLGGVRAFMAGGLAGGEAPLVGRPGEVWRELPRRIVVAALLAPSALLPRHSTHLVPYRWRLAYALGFIHAALGWGATGSPMRSAG